MIELTNVTLSHRGLPVLRDTTLSINPGEAVLLTGETGAGKTTLLRALYGDHPLNTGRIMVAGTMVNGSSGRNLPKLRRRMGLIFQDDKLLEDRSVYDNIRFALSISMKGSRAITRRALEILTELGLSHLRSHMPAQLSAGEAQRIGIARALANNPDIILADEPTGDLDISTAREILHYLAGHYTHEKIFLITTHDPILAQEAFPYARRWHMEHGSIRQTAPGIRPASSDR
ncbi:MAG: ATP-binding cassette domain-containing protein [Candidatus Kapaibacterium sp.]